jgi:hypothetical protein
VRRISKKTRAEAIEALLACAESRTNGRLRFEDQCSGSSQAIGLAFKARWYVDRDGDEPSRDGRNRCHVFAAAASLLDAGWSP